MTLLNEHLPPRLKSAWKAICQSIRVTTTNNGQLHPFGGSGGFIYNTIVSLNHLDEVWRLCVIPLDFQRVLTMQPWSVVSVTSCGPAVRGLVLHGEFDHHNGPLSGINKEASCEIRTSNE